MQAETHGRGRIHGLESGARSALSGAKRAHDQQLAEEPEVMMQAWRVRGVARVPPAL